MRRSRAPSAIAALLLAAAGLAGAGEFCGTGEAHGAQMLQVSNGEDTETFIDYRDTFRSLYAELDYCVCQPGHKQLGWLFMTHKAPCKEMFEDLLDKLDNSKFQWPPPREMPEELKGEYTLDGRVQVSSMYFSQKYNQNPKPHPWTHEEVEGMVAKARNRDEFSYGHETHFLYNTFETHGVAGQRGVVLGSEKPWLEGILLAQGVSNLTTVEYNRINSEHSAVSTLTPRELAESWLDGRLPVYDFAVSFSSYEHDGLGRYGDPIDPWGDIWDVRRITCFVKPGGLLFLGLPLGPDQVVWNAHRIYGPTRLPLMTANWELVAAWNDGGWVRDFTRIWNRPPGMLGQPLLVLRNRREEPCSR